MKVYFDGITNVNACFSQRDDQGFSKEPFSQLNLGLSTGDNPEDVQKNRSAFLNRLSYTPNDAAFAHQTHSDRVQRVTRAGIYTECDALITQEKNLPLLIQVADCACVFLYDDENHAIGLVHSGWRGSSMKIVSNTLNEMNRHFGTEPKNCLAVISPCISKDHFEVGQDVFELFLPKYFTPKSNNKYLFDMKHYLVDELNSFGVQSVTVDNACTFSESKSYFSFRRDREQSGRMMGCIVLV